MFLKSEPTKMPWGTKAKMYCLSPGRSAVLTRSPLNHLMMSCVTNPCWNACHDLRPVDAGSPRYVGLYITSPTASTATATVASKRKKGMRVTTAARNTVLHTTAMTPAARKSQNNSRMANFEGHLEGRRRGGAVDAGRVELEPREADEPEAAITIVEVVEDSIVYQVKRMKDEFNGKGRGG